MELVGSYSKRLDLADTLVRAVEGLRQAQGQVAEPVVSVHRTARSTRQPRVGDRLTEADEGQLVAAFTAGTSKRELAEHYGISESSVKRLIRRYGASKASNGALSSAFTRGIVTSPADGGTAEESNLPFAVASSVLVTQ